MVRSSARLLLLTLPTLGLGASVARAQPPGEESQAPVEPEPSSAPAVVDEPVPEPAITPEATPAPPPATPAVTPEATPPPPVATAETTPPASEERPPREHPRLVIAGGPVVGPHAFGNEECSVEQARCETKGSFFGLGGQLELRGRLWRPLYLHARGLLVGNVSPNDRIHRGAWAAGVGVGVYGRHVFGRSEYLYLDAFGDNHFEPPFYDGEVATDEWGHHAGLLSVGFRQPLPHGLAAELWGGLMLGPRSVRRVPQLEPDERMLTTFIVGLNLSWDAWR